MEAVVKSREGFYVGDICYVLNDEIYHGVWGKEHHYEDGVYEEPRTGISFAVASTAYGDGTYYDGEGNEYGVDAGVIGIVPLELVDSIKGLDGGRVFFQRGEAAFEEEDGVFYVEMPNGERVIIDTRGEESAYDDTEYEDDWDDYDHEYAPGDGDLEVGFDPYLGCYTDDV